MRLKLYPELVGQRIADLRPLLIKPLHTRKGAFNRQSQAIENTQTLRHCGKTGPPEVSATLGLPRAWTYPTQSSFSFSGGSSKEHTGTGAEAPNQEATSLPTEPSVLWRPLSPQALHLRCALTLLMFDPASKALMTIPGSKVLPGATHQQPLFICWIPLAPLSKTAPHLPLLFHQLTIVSFWGGRMEFERIYYYF